MKKILSILTALLSVYIITSCSSSNRDDAPEYIEVSSFGKKTEGTWYSKSQIGNNIVNMKFIQSGNDAILVLDYGNEKYSGKVYVKNTSGSKSGYNVIYNGQWKVYFKLPNRNEYSSISIEPSPSAPISDVVKLVTIENFSSFTIKTDFNFIARN
ncbi:hypothetical protein OZ668_10910 [Elizabethkingia sp. HX XZB]|uniref:hypothetical protein n=1 Tax=Elizabethkingia sp. HX XZB TaxID=3003193 RepID=UPI002A247552|nr:hypothetical protein [Elizabethkingia sp. HX XZB]MDX8568501.1 hypothetical protein [Elizabethkingia sp. HX XZB]